MQAPIFIFIIVIIVIIIDVFVVFLFHKCLSYPSITAVLQKRLTWALFVVLADIFYFINFPILLPPPPQDSLTSTSGSGLAYAIAAYEIALQHSYSWNEALDVSGSKDSLMNSFVC